MRRTFPITPAVTTKQQFTCPSSYWETDKQTATTTAAVVVVVVLMVAIAAADSSKSAVMELQCRALPHTMNIQKAKN